MSSESYGHCATGPGVGGPRSLVAAVTAVLTAIAVMGVTAWQGGFGTTGANPGRHAPGGRVLRRYTDPAGWSLRYPRDWHLEQSEQELHLAEIEVTVANFAPRSGIRVHTYPGGGNVRVVPPLARSGRFPSDGVALRLENPSGYPSSPSPDTRLPVGLRSLRASKTIAGLAYDAATGETFGGALGAPGSRIRNLTLDGSPWTALVWIGPKAPASSVRSLRQVLASPSVGPRNPLAP